MASAEYCSLYLLVMYAIKVESLRRGSISSIKSFKFKAIEMEFSAANYAIWSSSCCLWPGPPCRSLSNSCTIIEASPLFILA